SRVEGRGRYLDLGRLTPAEYAGWIAALVLVCSLFLPWFGTNEDNGNSRLAGAGGGDTVNAWQTFGLLDLVLVAAASAPFILSWILARGHKLTWKPGEVTMVVGITAFVLLLCNGVILGRPKNEATDLAIEISLQIGYFVALLACLAMAASGYVRQSRYKEGRKPPGVI
ncbi:MAG: hypothetical protein ACR2FZ_03140, partial [Thermoleophilaceae bacterium]